MNYEYKEKEKKNGLCVSVRDRGENALLEVERKGENIKITTYVHNDKTTHITIPVDIFEKITKRMTQS